MARVTLTTPLPPQFYFLALVSFLVRPKPKIPFLGLSFLRKRLLRGILLGQRGLLMGTGGKRPIADQRVSYNVPRSLYLDQFPPHF